MRRLIIAAAAIAAFATAGSLASTGAQAMPLNGLSAQTESAVVPAYTKCRWVWEYGYRVQRCWEVYDAPRYYAPPPVYVPRPRYYGGYGAY